MVLSVLLAVGAFTLVQAHWILNVPPTLGFDDVYEGIAPCGNIDPSLRNGTITRYPIAGHPIGFLNTHSHALFEFSVATLDDLDHWEPVGGTLSTHGAGEFCIDRFPLPRRYVGKNAVLQIIELGGDPLYQCAAIRVTKGRPIRVPDNCVNGTGVHGEWV
ncbi:hypothetical protein S7711_01302 [Stachybotrys chartarum IBT 7711]|uniref:Copper acquisition factor BIM1-like domain-containing protein n=1 Tax=Stachybotrys chartarum (strain CBS 109288 / IBT 7711) TaxID=1280523 RepID=A0A084BBM4_STACB|nr:hypothetical protein S7711_01302 [Stachybotrys chartarum IBT 7711]KFA51872.1 hypothetical protein S40293_04061 [Stachybotrys chartarum IBT 40293]